MLVKSIFVLIAVVLRLEFDGFQRFLILDLVICLDHIGI